MAPTLRAPCPASKRLLGKDRGWLYVCGMFDDGRIYHGVSYDSFYNINVSLFERRDGACGVMVILLMTAVLALPAGSSRMYVPCSMCWTDGIRHASQHVPRQCLTSTPHAALPAPTMAPHSSQPPLSPPPPKSPHERPLLASKVRRPETRSNTSCVIKTRRDGVARSELSTALRRTCTTELEPP
jgi:hypothetical protein